MACATTDCFWLLALTSSFLTAADCRLLLRSCRCSPPQNTHTYHTPPLHSEKEIKQLQGWKATVENLMERFEDLIRQTQLLAEIEDPSAAAAGAAAR